MSPKPRGRGLMCLCPSLPLSVNLCKGQESCLLELHDRTYSASFSKQTKLLRGLLGLAIYMRMSYATGPCLLSSVHPKQLCVSAM